jgi:serine/threonine protein kinase
MAANGQHGDSRAASENRDDARNEKEDCSRQPPFAKNQTGRTHMNADHPNSPASGDPLLENRASDLFRPALCHSASSPLTQSWEPPPPQELAHWLPQYQIDRLIGRGAMAAVYHGVQLSLNREVAIKLLPSELAASIDFVQRFQREAQTLAQLQHPGIVAVFDSGQTSEGHLYFVMEFVDGTNLHQIIHGPGLSPEQALEFTIQICEALHYAHRQGVIHRDIKPANVLVTQEGFAKLADFGLSRPVTLPGATLTATSLVMGTPDYMAPEQWEGKADQRADIYALGVTLYEMLTGSRPQGVFELPSKRTPVDARLDQVVIKAMRQEPDRRYQQISELRQDVERIRTMRVPAGTSLKSGLRSSPRRKGKASDAMGWIIASLVLVTLGGVGAFLAWNGGAKRETVAPTHPVVIPPPEVPAGAAGSVVPKVKETVQVHPAPPAQPEAVPPASAAPARPETVAPATPPPTPLPAPAVITPPPAVVVPAPPPVSVTPERQPLIAGLSSEAPNLIRWGLAPLAEQIPPDIRQSLTFLREDLVDEGKTKPVASIDAYRAAYYLCDALISTLDERDRARVASGYRAAQADANTRVTNQSLDAHAPYRTSWPQYARIKDQRAEIQRQQNNNTALTRETIKVDWSNRVKVLQRSLDALYAKYRDALRQSK